ncbi:MAG: putative molybdopterin biosynthesis protein [Paracoccaceae bacterium]
MPRACFVGILADQPQGMPTVTDNDDPASAYLTTREVAALLRVKERKVYDLAAAGEIPHRRITGKLLFPAAEVTAWIEGGAPAAPAIPPASSARPAILAGSHDPLLDWAVRESGCGLATMFDGSGAGLTRFADGGAALCGMHIPEADGWNIGSVSEAGLTGVVLIAWAARRQGLIVPAGTEGGIRGIADLAGRRVMLRQPGAGARALFDKLTAGTDLSRATILPDPARTETDAALAVASGDADVALGLEAAARQCRLGFVPLAQERFDLLIDRRAYFEAPVQALLAFARGAALRDKAARLTGYDVTDLGRVRWVSP